MIRAVGVLVASAVAGTGVFASTTAVSAEETTPPPPTFEILDLEAFADEALQLPTGLVEAIQRDLGLSPAEYLAHAAAARSAADVVDQLEADGVEIEGSRIDGQELTVYVGAESDVGKVEATGAIAVLGLPEIDISILDKPEFYAQQDFRGGYGYAGEVADGITRCSSGFNGTGSDGAPLFFTAGHCGADLEDGAPWYWLDVDGPIYDDETWVENWDDNPLGQNGPMHFGEGNDGGIVHVTEPDWTLLPQVATWGGGDGDGAPDDGQAVKVYDSTDPIVGQPACKSGATSGWKCGEVLFEEDTADVEGNDVMAFIFNACMLGGDSGGSIVSGNYALGVDSFSTEEAMDSCGGWEPATTYEEGGFADGDIGGGFAVTAGSANAETLFGDDFNLSIHVGTPSVTSPEDGGTTGQTPTISGTVQAAEGATVTVEIESGPTVEGTVAADGSWSAEVSEALEPGTYNYTATASHTADGASQATTSGEATGSFEVVEQQVEELAVESPTDGQTTDNARPSFSGTGQPGATVSLTVGGEDFGEAEVAEDGTWSIAPSADLPVGVRFDALVTQTFEDDTQEVTVADLGINAPDVTITAPEDGSTVAGDVVFEGTSFPGATVSLEIEGTVSESSQRLETAADEVEPAQDTWEGDFVVEDDGSWTFTPAEALEDGDYTVTATATLEGGDPELSNSEAAVSFAVAAGGDGEDDDDLPDTGSSNIWLIFVGVGLLALGGVAIALRARRSNNTTA